MPPEPLRLLISRLRRLTDRSGEGGLSDAHLLERFLTQRDEAAFEVLVWRHGALVLSVCRRLLRHEQDVEDAFQATFLALTRKAGSIGRREALAGWLYKVAYRVALAARAAALSRTKRERPWVDLPAGEEDDLVWRDLRPVLDEEVNRLPERYRVPFVLCCLEGKTNEEAAELLGCPKGTVLSRLARARERLQLRLTRRGVVLSAGLLPAAVAEKGQAATVAAGLVQTTVRAAGTGAAGKATAGVSAGAATLAEGVLRAMFLKKLKVALAVVLAVAVGGLGAGMAAKAVLAGGAAGEDGSRRASRPPATQEGKPAAGKGAQADHPGQLMLRRLQSQRNLRRIGQALWDYYNRNGHFPPPALSDKDGRALLSWRVLLLPYLKEDTLYKQFKLDEPWDGPHNKKLLADIPSVYAPVGEGTKEPGLTYYEAFVGPGAAFERGRELRLPDFPDGTVNTIWVVEAGSPVPWTKPEDLPYAPGRALPKLGGLFGGDFHALFMDGSVHTLSRRAEEAQLRAAITRNDSTTLDWRRLQSPGVQPGGPPGVYPGGTVDPEQLTRLNAQLKAARQAARQEVDKANEELASLKAQIAQGIFRFGPKTAKLVKENTELQQSIDRALEELETLRAQKAWLEHLEQSQKNK